MTTKQLTEAELQSKTKEELIQLVLKLQSSLPTSTPTATASSSKPDKKKKKQKSNEFDFSKHHFRTIALKFAYFGWSYQGLARQANGANTVEEHFFQALEKTKLIEHRDKCNYTRCGRTDKGVSALSQVVGLRVRSNLSPEEQENPSLATTKQELDYIKMLNNVLPDDIRILAWAPVPLHFDARFNCIYRTYKYFFIKKDMNIDLMREAARSFIGSHDYRNFCKISVENVKTETSLRRVILGCDIRKSDLFLNAGNSNNTEDEHTIYEFVVCGYSFLWHQVRCMTEILFLVGKGLEKPSIVAELLDVSKQKSRPQYDIASELPLVLWDCGFEDIHWKVSPPHQRVEKPKKQKKGKQQEKQEGPATIIIEPNYDTQFLMEKHFYKIWKHTAIKSAIFTQFLKATEATLFDARESVLRKIQQGQAQQAASTTTGAISSSQSQEQLVEWSKLKPKVLDFVRIKNPPHVPLQKRPTAFSYEEAFERYKAKQEGKSSKNKDDMFDE